MERIDVGGRMAPWSGDHAARAPVTRSHDDGRRPGAPAARRRCTHAHLRIDGLTCAAEVVGVERHLLREPGVIHVAVNPMSEIAYVVYDPDRTHLSTIRQAIEHAGFAADTRSTSSAHTDRP